MKRLTFLLTGILFTILVTAQDYVSWTYARSKSSVADGGYDVYGLIIKKAEKNWGDDYTMVLHEIKSQCKAYYDIVNIEKPGLMTTDHFENLRANTIIKWSKFDNKTVTEIDWVMANFELKRQIKSYLELNQNKP